MTSPWQEWKKANSDRQRSGRVSPLDFINPNTEYIDDTVADSRLSVCSSCDNYRITKQCSKCGCFMPAKVKLKFATCPEGLWT